MGRIIGNTTATPMVVPDWNQTDEKKADYIKNKPTIVDENLTNVTNQGLINITSKEFGEISVNLHGIIKKGQKITNFKAFFVDETIGTNEDEYTDYEIILSAVNNANDVVFLYRLPYDCGKDYKFEHAQFRRKNDGEYTDTVNLIVGDNDKIATTKHVEEKVGDIETALDAIISIQRESVGG